MDHKLCSKNNISHRVKQIHVNSHQRKSNNQNPNLYCNRGDCQKTFSNQILLDIHLKLHDNNLINCHYCPWRGTKHADLIDHMNHHFLIRPFKCSFCASSFYVVDTRNKHETDVHERISNRYQCDKCPFITHSRSICNTHKRNHHWNTHIWHADHMFNEYRS